MGPAIIALLLALAPAPSATPSPPSLSDADISEAGCRVLVKGESGKPVVRAAPDLHVLLGAAAEGPFKPSLPPRTEAILCYRNTIVPAEHDDEVLALGLPLMLRESGEKGRIAYLEMVEGRFQYRFEKGDLSSEEQGFLQERINRFQNRSQTGP